MELPETVRGTIKLNINEHSRIILQESCIEGFWNYAGYLERPHTFKAHHNRVYDSKAKSSHLHPYDLIDIVEHIVEFGFLYYFLTETKAPRVTTMINPNDQGMAIWRSKILELDHPERISVPSGNHYPAGTTLTQMSFADVYHTSRLLWEYAQTLFSFNRLRYARSLRVD